MPSPTLLTQLKGNVSLPTAMPGNYTIVESQLPLVGGMGGHNLLVLKDPNGNVIGELDGLATGADGTIKPIGYLSTDTLKVYETAGSYLWSSSQTQATVFTGTFSQAATLWNTAAGCGAAINNENLSYPWMGLGSNSNSVASTLDACLGITEPTSVAKNATFTPGVGTLLLSPSTISSEQQLNGAPQSAPPSADSITSVTNNGGTETIRISEPNGATQVDTVSPASSQSSQSEQQTFNSSGTLINDEKLILNSNGNETGSISGTGLVANINGVGFSAANGTSCTIYGSNDTVSANSSTVSLTGTNDSLSGASDVVQLGSGSTATVNTTSSTVGLAGNDTVWQYGSSNTVNVNGTGNAAVVYGTYEKSNELGSNNKVWDYGSHDTDAVNSSGSELQVWGSANSASVGGSGNTTFVENANEGTTSINGSAEKTVLNGSGVTVADHGGSDTDWVANSSDTLDIYNSYTKAYVESSNDVTWELGSNEFAQATGSNDVTHRANATDGVADLGSGDEYQNDWSGSYYSGDPGGGYGGYYGYYGLAGTSPSVDAKLGANIGGIAQRELAKGHVEAGTAAQRAHAQVAAEAAIFNATGGVASSVLEAAKWDQKVVTWSLADPKGDANSTFSGKIDAQYESSIKKAFDAWSAASGLKFVEVADSSASNIRIGWSDLDTADTAAVGYTTFRAKDGHITSAQIRLEDPNKTALLGGAAGTYSGTDASFQQVVEHEIGHTLGLGSNADPNSIMFYELDSQNRSLDDTDLSGVHSIYGSPANAADTGVGQLVQALASMGGVPAGSAAPVPPSMDAAAPLLLHAQTPKPPTAHGDWFNGRAAGAAHLMAA